MSNSNVSKPNPAYLNEQNEASLKKRIADLELENRGLKNQGSATSPGISPNVGHA